MTPSSWVDHHLPEMLWAALLLAVLPRGDALDAFRKLVVSHAAVVGNVAGSQSTDRIAQLDYCHSLDHTNLAVLTDTELNSFVQSICNHPLGSKALRPLLLLDSLPGIQRWRQFIEGPALDDDWSLLARAVGSTLDHQSEQSTDIRWLKVVTAMRAGRIRLPAEMEEQFYEVRDYPNRGDLRRVRPFIRSMEMTFRRSSKTAWLPAFWAEVLENTRCIDPTDPQNRRLPPTAIDPASLYRARFALRRRFFQQLSANRTDPRLDTAFGYGFYALALLEEVGACKLDQKIAGRLILRTLTEARITLGYLVKHDRSETWESHRVYGAGQAKLAFLKAQEGSGDLPEFIDPDALSAIANEDIWQEFLPIELGHWAKSNLRAMADSAGLKDIYDRYYAWTSAYGHAHWGAMRDSNFLTCYNPLHRLHRVPRVVHRELESTELDMIELVNGIVDDVARLFPDGTPLPHVSTKAGAGTESQCSESPADTV